MAIGMSGGIVAQQPITLGEIKNYLSLYPVNDVYKFIELIKIMDREFLDYMSKNNGSN